MLTAAPPPTGTTHRSLSVLVAHALPATFFAV
jgi:hypothetical protein